MINQAEQEKLDHARKIARETNCFIAIKNTNYLIYRKGPMRNMLILKTKSLDSLLRVIKNQLQGAENVSNS